jgi:hypothetical protein
LVAGGPAAAATPRPSLVAAGNVVALAVGSTVRWYDHRGQRLGQLPAGARDDDNGDRRSNAAAAPERADLARERAFDDLDIPEGLRDRDDARDLADDELSWALRRDERAARTAAPAAPTPAPSAFVLAVGNRLLAFVGGRIWQIEAGRPAAPLGNAPAGLTAVVATRAGLVLAARGTDILASRDAGRSFTVIDRLSRPPAYLAVDPAGAFFAAGDSAHLELVYLAAGDRQPQRLTFLPKLPVRDVAACGEGGLLVLADDGTHLVTPDGSSRLVAPAAPGAGLACVANGQRSGAPWVLFGPGGVAAAPPRSDLGPALVPVPGWTGSVEAAAGDDGNGIWIFSHRGGLVHLGTGGAAVQVAPAGPTDVGIGSPVRATWRGLLPHLSLLGRRLDAGGKRTLMLGLVAEWHVGQHQRGHTTLDREIRDLASEGLLQRAGFTPAAEGPGPTTAASPGPPLPPAGGAPQDPRIDAPATGGQPMAYAPAGSGAGAADPDGPCLAKARVHAVAIAAAEPERARSLLTRAGRSAWLPELRLRAERRVGRSESLDYKPTATSDALGLDTDNAVRYEVRATWDLPRLVFNPDEIGAASQALRINEMRREIESQVNRLYYERRRLLVTPPLANGEDATTWQIRIEELEADLDALSGGAFARCRRGQHLEAP